jgi:hypothetical protein
VPVARGLPGGLFRHDILSLQSDAKGGNEVALPARGILRLTPVVCVVALAVVVAACGADTGMAGGHPVETLWVEQ